MTKTISYRLKLRYLSGFIAGFILILFGAVRRAKLKLLSGRFVTAITFHNPEKQLFQKSIKWLKDNGFIFISTHQLIELIENKSEIPKGAVWLSLDDGWLENMNNVIPVISEFRIPVCFFIATGPVEKNGIFWWTIPNLLPDSDQRQLNIDLWAAKESERKAVCEQLVKKINVHQLHRQCMTIEDIQVLAKTPHVTIGCHTVHHGLHVNCTDAEIESEIKKSQKTLEDWIDQKVFSFAYPAGSYKGNEGKILNKYDIKAGFTIDSRPISPEDDPNFLPRYVCMDNGFLSENICHMLGIWAPFISKLKRYSFLSQISKWQKTLP